MKMKKEKDKIENFNCLCKNVNILEIINNAVTRMENIQKALSPKYNTQLQIAVKVHR